MKNQKIKVQGDEIVGKDPKGGQYIVLPFVFPDKSMGSVVIIKVSKKEWKPNLKEITLEYENSTK